MGAVGRFVGELRTNACLYPSSSSENSEDEEEKYHSPDVTLWKVELDVDRSGGRIKLIPTFQPHMLTDFEYKFYNSDDVQVTVLPDDKFELVWKDIEEDRIAVTLEPIAGSTDTFRGNWVYLDNPDENDATGTLQLKGNLQLVKAKSAAK